MLASDLAYTFGGVLVALLTHWQKSQSERPLHTSPETSRNQIRRGAGATFSTVLALRYSLPNAIIDALFDFKEGHLACRLVSRVFISYSHDSDEHKTRVLEIAQRLRQDGLDCQLDQFILGHPPEGWPRWMKHQLEQADYVLVICTETYARRFDGQEAPGRGLGATWEGLLSLQDLYESGGRNRKYLPVILSDKDWSHIPTPLRSVTVYRIPADYDALYRYVTGAPSVVPQPIGPTRKLPARSTAASPDSAGAYRDVREGVSANWLDRKLRDPTLSSSALEDLDVLLTAPSLECSERSELLLKKAVLFQKLGFADRSFATLDEYTASRPKRSRPDAEYHICLGKLVAQLDSTPDRLQQYVVRLSSRPAFKGSKGRALLSPLYWRLGLICRPTDGAESNKYLALHESALAPDSYQFAHNQQCRAFATLIDGGRKRKPAIQLGAQVEMCLHNAFEHYTSLQQFLYRDKCIASNLMMLGAFYLQHRQPKRGYECLLHARSIFDRLQVKPSHEAVSEIGRLLRMLYPDAFELVFGSDLARTVSRHRDGDLIRELYCDVSACWADTHIENCHIDVPQLYTILTA